MKKNGRKRKRQFKRSNKKMSEPPGKHRKPSSSSTDVKESSGLLANMRKRLKGAQFRWLNEKLYTCAGGEAFEYFQENPKMFEKYHEGFSRQADSWSRNPLDEMIAILKRKRQWVVGDFGCGEARLAQSVPNKVYSFDLVAINEHVVACNMANVPLEDGKLDAAVFCLSLMGTNLSDFIREARRCLRSNGTLLVAEVISRMSEHGQLNDKAFINAIESEGFKLTSRRILSKMFILMNFRKKEHVKRKDSKVSGRRLEDNISRNPKGKKKKRKGKTDTSSQGPIQMVLAPCRYKKR
eukprot:jgi/Bigna1/48775/estExt_Genewise1.C_310141